MKIAFVVHDYHRAGGHSRYVAELATRFAREHEVHVFANTFEPSHPAGIIVHHVPAWRRTALTTILTFMLPATVQLRGEFDIVHTQGFCSFNRADVITAHICSDAWYRARNEVSGDVTWKERVFAAVLNPLERRMYRRSVGSWVIAVSERIRRDLAVCYGCGDRMSVIYHGVDLEQFTPDRRSSDRDEVRRRIGLVASDVAFLFVGDLRKGAPIAIEALHDTPGAKLILVSRTPTERYRQMAEALGVRDRAVFVPPTNRIEEYYAAADAFVFPSPYDAFGMVVTEAMASGLPAIVSTAAGAAELIEHERDGLLLDDPSSVERVADAMRRLTGDSELRQRLGTAARRRVESLTWDEIAAKTMEVYRRALAG
jgi:UDP-glucose:(heptosyl)LPS alpha-1,3-glucosyltransferase